MNHLTLLKIFRMMAALAIISGFSACAFRQPSSITDENTATQFTSYATYPETIPRWGSADPHTGSAVNHKVGAALDPSTDWGHGILTQLGD